MEPYRDGNRNKFAQHLFAGLPARYDRLAELLSFGQNGRWRREMVSHVVPGRPRRVLDVCSGTAGVAIQLADRTGAGIVGVDLTLDMLEVGRRRVEEAHRAEEVSLVNARAEQLPFADATFDAATFTYLFRYVDDPAATLCELARVTRPGARVASLEFNVPSRPLWRPLWWAYTRVVLPLAGLLTGGVDWFRVGRFLGPSISGLYRDFPLDEQARAWELAGFEEVGWRAMSLGGGLVMWGRRAGD